MRWQFTHAIVHIETYGERGNRRQYRGEASDLAGYCHAGPWADTAVEALQYFAEAWAKDALQEIYRVSPSERKRIAAERAREAEGRGEV